MIRSVTFQMKPSLPAPEAVRAYLIMRGVEADRDDGGEVAVAGTPEPVVVMSAESGRQAVFFSKEINRSRLAVISDINDTFRLFFGSELTVDSRNEGDHFFPSKHIGVLLLDLSRPVVLGLVLDDTLTRLNALKQFIAFAVNVAAAVFFVFSGHVIWPVALVMAVGALIGGVLGGRLAGIHRGALVGKVFA